MAENSSVIPVFLLQRVCLWSEPVTDRPALQFTDLDGSEQRRVLVPDLFPHCPNKKGEIHLATGYRSVDKREGFTSRISPSCWIYGCI